jgi:hypothetical protein
MSSFIILHGNASGVCNRSDALCESSRASIRYLNINIPVGRYVYNVFTVDDNKSLLVDAIDVKRSLPPPTNL